MAGLVYSEMIYFDFRRIGLVSFCCLKCDFYRYNIDLFLSIHVKVEIRNDDFSKASKRIQIRSDDFKISLHINKDTRFRNSNEFISG